MMACRCVYLHRVMPWLLLQCAVAGVRAGIAGDDLEEPQLEGQAREGTAQSQVFLVELARAVRV